MMSKNWHKQSGTTIVELMISIFVGILLTIGVIEIFLSNKLSYTIAEGMARVQENGRFFSHIIHKEIRMAGFYGCGGLSQTTPNNQILAPPAILPANTRIPITGNESTGATSWSPALPAVLIGKVAAGTDVITIYKGTTYTNLSNPMTSGANAINVDNRLTITPGDLFAISDCQFTDIIKASVGSTATVINHTTADNSSGSLSTAYDTDSVVMEFDAISFYVKDTGRTNSSGQPILSLFKMDIDGTEDEIVEGVENIQITYGLDLTADNSVNSYVDAQAVAAANNFDKVIGVKITALMNSINDVNQQSIGFTFNGTAQTTTDRLLRREYSAFIQLRNKGL